MICPYCEKEILKEDSKFMIALEKPYYNIYFHKSCLISIENIRELLQNKVQIWYNKNGNIKK